MPNFRSRLDQVSMKDTLTSEAEETDGLQAECHEERHESDVNSLVETDETVKSDLNGWRRSFKQRQEEYFAELLGRKWDCSIQGHGICVPMVDGQHFQISEEGTALWVKALCLGEATTAQPPDGVLDLASDCKSTDGARLSAFQAVSIAPSRSRNARPLKFSLAASLHGDSKESIHSMFSRVSSGNPGPGYYSGKALKWFGEKALNAFEEFVIIKRTHEHLSCLKEWSRLHSAEIGIEKQKKTLEIIEDALEMSKPYYPDRVNRAAVMLGRRVVAWITTSPRITMAKETDSWLVQVHACLAPLALAKTQSDPAIGDLVWELLEALTKIPLALHGPETTSAVIRILANELAFSPYTIRHPWLGNTLSALVLKTLKLRSLSEDELGAIHDMAVRRMEQNTDMNAGFCRPWEPVIFAECASQDGWFQDVVLDISGLHELTHALERALDKPIVAFRDYEEFVNMDGILHALVVLTRYVWVVDALESKLVRILVNAVRRTNLWETWRFQAIIIIRNMVSHRPKMLRALIQVNSVHVLELAKLTWHNTADGKNSFLRQTAVEDVSCLLNEMHDFS